MKITNSEVITTGERELIDTITGDLDWDAIENVFRTHHKLGIGEDIEYKNGDIVVHDNRVAYKLEFEVKVILSLLLDRDGNYISIKSSADSEGPESVEVDRLSEEKEEVESESREQIDNDPKDPDLSVGEVQNESETGEAAADEDVESEPQEQIDNDPEDPDPDVGETHIESELEEAAADEGAKLEDGYGEAGSELGSPEGVHGQRLYDEIEEMGSESQEKTDTDPEDPDPDVRETHIESELEEAATGEGTDVEDGYEEAVLELNPPEAQERAEIDEPLEPTEGDSQERISRMAYQSGQLMTDLVEGSR